MTIEEIPAPDNTKQIWKKGEDNKEGYFTLMNERSEKFLTAVAVSTNDFETSGTENRKKSKYFIALYHTSIFYSQIKSHLIKEKVTKKVISARSSRSSYFALQMLF